jgi:hypothetical protein
VLLVISLFAAFPLTFSDLKSADDLQGGSTKIFSLFGKQKKVQQLGRTRKLFFWKFGWIWLSGGE